MKIPNPFKIKRQRAFDFPGSAEEGIALLSQFIGNESLRPKLDDGLIGKLQANHVEIWLHRPFSKSLLLPVFHGDFVNVNGRNVLMGEFRIHKAVRTVFYLGIIAIMLFWLSIAIRDNNITSPIIACIANIAFMYIGLYLSRSISLREVETIESQIKKILTQGCI